MMKSSSRRRRRRRKRWASIVARMGIEERKYIIGRKVRSKEIWEYQNLCGWITLRWIL
jgi:hypothetical protein